MGHVRRVLTTARSARTNARTEGSEGDLRRSNAIPEGSVGPRTLSRTPRPGSLGAEPAVRSDGALR